MYWSPRTSLATRRVLRRVAATPLFLMACGDPAGGEQKVPQDLLWFVPEAGSAATPAADATGATVFVYTDVRDVLALDALTGAIKWRSNYHGASPGAIGTGIAVLGDVVAVGGVNVEAFRASSGQKLWSHGQGTSNEGLRPIATDGEAFYLSSREGLVSKVNPTTGQDVWVADVTQGDTTVGAFGAAIVGGRVYVTATRYSTIPTRGSLTALDAATGAQLWHYPYDDTSPKALSTSSVTPPAVIGNIVAAAVSDGRIFAHDVLTGDLRWTAPGENPDSLQGGELRFLAAGDGALIATTSSGRITRLNHATGAVLWRAVGQRGTPIRPPAIGDGLVVVTHQPPIVGYDLATGAVRFVRPDPTEYDLGSPPSYRVFAGALISKRVVYWVGTDGIRARKLP